MLLSNFHLPNKVSLKLIHSAVEEIGRHGNTNFLELWPFTQGTVYISIMMSFVGISVLEQEGYSYLLFLADMTSGSRTSFFLSSDWTWKSQELVHQNAIIYQWIIADTRDDPYLPSMVRGIPQQSLFSVVYFKLYYKVDKILYKFWAEYCCNNYNVSCLKHLPNLLQPQEFYSQNNFFNNFLSLWAHVAVNFV